MALSSKHCVPCRGGIPPLAGDRIRELLEELGQGWQVIDDHHLSREFEFKDFAEALSFVNRVGAIAEREGHHPDIHLSWGKVRVEIWTHKIDGLTESDFILAAKADEALPV
jgi:4a-hydroxytetrahydrobiopterin dehydratase